MECLAPTERGEKDCKSVRGRVCCEVVPPRKKREAIAMIAHYYGSLNTILSYNNYPYINYNIIFILMAKG